MAGAISQDEQAPNRGVLIIKKSILERFSWRAFFGQKEKSFRKEKFLAQETAEHLLSLREDSNTLRFLSTTGLIGF